MAERKRSLGELTQLFDQMGQPSLELVDAVRTRGFKDIGLQPNSSYSPMGQMGQDELSVLDRLAEGAQDAENDIPRAFLKGAMAFPYEAVKARAMSGGGDAAVLRQLLALDPALKIDHTTSPPNLRNPVAYLRGIMRGLKNRKPLAPDAAPKPVPSYQ